MAADQPHVRQIHPGPLAGQTGRHDVKVVRMAGAHDQYTGARRQISDRCLHRIGVLTAHIRRYRLWKYAVPAVHPRHVTRQTLHALHQGLTHMSTPEQAQGPVPGGQAFAQGRRIGRLHQLKAQMHLTTAALPQAGAQGKTPLRCGGIPARLMGNQHLSGQRQGVQLQTTATYGSHEAVS